MRERVLAPDHDTDRSLGWLALAWIEHFCVHGPGDVQGVPLTELPLDDEFAGLLVDVYCLDIRGRRLYDSGFLSRGKGRAKSEWASFGALFEALGPCRFAGFAKGGETYKWRDFSYTYARKEPMGKPIVYPFIRCLATEETQAGNTYDNIYFNLTHGPLSEDLPKDCAGLTRVLLPGGGEIVPSTASNASKDGGKETFVVFDETHLYTKPELRKMYDTVRRNMAKRKAAEPWSLETSTMYLPGENSVAEATHELAKRISEGKTKRSRLFFDHRQAPEGIDLGDEAQVEHALREVYGPFAEVMDLRRIMDEILDLRNDPGDSRRYYFNEPTAAIDSFTSEPLWAACKATDVPAFQAGDVITLGFDGSRGKRARGKPDATGLVGTRLSDGHQQVLGHWEAGETGWDVWEPPVSVIDETVRRVFGTFKVAAFYADPPGWREYINTWERDLAPALLAAPGGKQVKSSGDHPFEWWMVGYRSERVQRAIEAYSDAIVGKTVSHPGDPRFTAHVLNARKRHNPKLTLGKENEYSSKKIDLCVCGFLSWQAYLDCTAAGIVAAPRRSVYEDRGALFF
jgi:hypothetical protein